MAGMSKVFKAKFDSWMVALLAVLYVAGVIAAQAGGKLGFLLVWSVVFGVVGFLTFSFKYEVTDTHLVVHQCLFKSRIDVTTIKKEEVTRSVMSSPAPSLDRLCVTCGCGEDILISPKDKAGFVAALKAVSGQVEDAL